MPKDAYYFSHDANAHTDPKILKLRMALGWEGYGIYWAIIENLRCQENYSICESEFMFLTLSLAIDEAKLKQVLSKCLEVNLLQVIDSKVLSPSLLKRMEKADEIRNKRKIAGAKGGKAKANAKATLKQNSSIKGKERKGKEIKEDIKNKQKIFTPPQLHEVSQYCIERKNGIDAQKFIDHYSANGWMRGKNKIKDWKACVRTWEGNQQNQQQQTNEPQIYLS